MTRWMTVVCCMLAISGGRLAAQDAENTDVKQQTQVKATATIAAKCEKKCEQKCNSNDQTKVSAPATCAVKAGCCEGKCPLAKATCEMEGCKTSAAEFTWSFPILAGIPFVTDSPKAEIGVDFDVVRVEQGACEGEACELEETGPLAIVKWLNKEIAQKEAGQACQLRCEAAVCGIAQACGTKACGTKACETKACGQAKACGTQVCGTKACGQACDVASKQTCHSSSTHTAQSTCPTTKSAAKGQCPITAHSTWFHAAAKNCPIISGQVTAASCPEGKCQCGTKCQCGGEQVAKLKQKLQKTQLALMVQETISGVRQEAADRQRELQIQLAKAEARVEAQQAVIQFSVQHQQQQQQWLAVLAAQAPAAHQQATKQQVEQLAAENARLREVVEELQQHIRQASKANASSPYTR